MIWRLLLLWLLGASAASARLQVMPSCFGDGPNGIAPLASANLALKTSRPCGMLGGVAGQTTTMYYDTLYRATNIVQPDGTSVTNVYYPNGRLEMTAGSRTYPARYAYDYAGRLSGLTTWTNFAANTGANTTTWNYDAYQGLLNQKSYADGTATGYGYTAAGRVQTRTWARAGGTGLPGAVFGQLRRTGPLPVTAKPAENSSPLSTTYVYDTAGEVTNILYNDGATPAVASLYDRLGRPVSVTMGGMTTTNVYDLGGDRLLEAYLGGPLNGLAVSNAYDADMRRTALTVWSGTTPLATNNYAYDHASRLVSVGDGGAAAAGYGYVANSPLIACVTSRHNAAPLLTATRQYDYLNRLTRTVSTPAQSAAPASYAYAYNLANQRTTNTWGDGSHWAYQYDALGQVTNALRSWSDGTPVAGEQCQYAFDTIGNRTLTRAGGDTNGLNLRAAHYAANRVNEYTQRDVSGTNDVIGVALASANVTVNGAPADRKGEYFHGVAGTNNAGGPAWLSATIGAGSANASGSLYVAQTPEVFQYDADGNLTNDGRWTYTWDAENRLVAMAVNTGAGPPYQITNVYDAAGRRIQKIVTADGVTCATNTYVYDGWNVVAVLAGASRSLSATYLWGADLSGTAGGAGGIGKNQLAVAQESRKLERARQRAVVPLERQTIGHRPGLCHALGIAKGVHRRNRWSSPQELRILVSLGAHRGGGLEFGLAGAGPQSGRHGGTTLGRNFGALARRLDNRIFGRTQQSIFRDQT